MSHSNGNKRPVGRCALCGGVVSVPTAWMSVKRPVPECEKCGAIADEAANLPVMQMKKRDTHICEVTSHGNMLTRPSNPYHGQWKIASPQDCFDDDYLCAPGC